MLQGCSSVFGEWRTLDLSNGWVLWSGPGMVALGESWFKLVPASCAALIDRDFRTITWSPWSMLLSMFKACSGSLLGNCLSGERDRLIPAEWHSDLDKVVIEVPKEGSKVCEDADRCSFRKLLHDLESIAEVVDATVNSHELKRENREDGTKLTQPMKWPWISLPQVEVGSIDSFSHVLAVLQTHRTLPRHGHLQYLAQAEDDLFSMEPAVCNQSVQVDISSFSFPDQGAWAALCSECFCFSACHTLPYNFSRCHVFWLPWLDHSGVESIENAHTNMASGIPEGFKCYLANIPSNHYCVFAIFASWCFPVNLVCSGGISSFLGWIQGGEAIF